MWKWLPIDEIILRNVVELLPNPIQSQKLRLPKICKKLLTFEKEYKGYSAEEKARLQKIKEGSHFSFFSTLLKTPFHWRREGDSALNGIIIVSL